MEANTNQASRPGLENFLSGPSPSSCSSERIDFLKTSLPEYSNSFVMMIHDLLTPEECLDLLQIAKSTTNGHWEQAMINIGGGIQRLATDTRNCGRIILDDFILAKRLQDRIMPHLPSEIVTLKDNRRITGNGPLKRKETWQLKRLNERLRFLKYTSGMYFRPHCDGSYVTPDGQEISFLTIHLYLNGDASATTPAAASGLIETKDDLPLEGGATRFFSWDDEGYFDVSPKTGACLVFQHRDLIHSGEDVVQGTKYTVRTDVMYGKI
jgi:2OG-Fe(II) oxygenase superfamily